jgi:hypothetical protein
MKERFRYHSFSSICTPASLHGRGIDLIRAKASKKKVDECAIIYYRQNDIILCIGG